MSTKYKVGDKVELHSNCREINQKDIDETGEGIHWSKDCDNLYEKYKEKGFTIRDVKEPHIGWAAYRRGKPIYRIAELHWWVCEHFIAGPHDKKNQPISW